MLDSCCAFTGHRPHKFPWRYNEADSRCVALKTAMTEHITKLVEDGVTDFYNGGADGVDCWASLIVLELRKKNPALRLHLILPHKGQENKWSDSAQERYHLILNQADSIEYVSYEYYDGCMLDRNHRLVELVVTCAKLKGFFPGSVFPLLVDNVQVGELPNNGTFTSRIVPGSHQVKIGLICIEINVPEDVAAVTLHFQYSQDKSSLEFVCDQDQLVTEPSHMEKKRVEKKSLRSTVGEFKNLPTFQKFFYILSCLVVVFLAVFILYIFYSLPLLLIPCSLAAEQINRERIRSSVTKDRIGAIIVYLSYMIFLWSASRLSTPIITTLVISDSSLLVHSEYA